MNKELIVHIFSSLQTLERELEKKKSSKEAGFECFGKGLVEKEKVLSHMRQVANKIQIHFARNDTAETVRLISVYYGLHQMIRPEISPEGKLPHTVGQNYPTTSNRPAVH